MEIITLRNIRLGDVKPSHQMLEISPIRDAEAGKMKISGAPGATVHIAYNKKMTLQQVDGNNEVMFNYEIAGNSRDDQATAELFNFRNQQAQLNGDGEYFLWIGGSVSLKRLEPGRYESDFTIEVDYL